MSFKTLEETVVEQTQSVIGNREATYIHANLVETDITIIFDNAFVEIEGVSSRRPIARINLADLPAVPGKGDTLVIEEVTYRVLMSEADSFGASVLILQKV